MYNFCCRLHPTVHLNHPINIQLDIHLSLYWLYFRHNIDCASPKSLNLFRYIEYKMNATRFATNVFEHVFRTFLKGLIILTSGS